LALACTCGGAALQVGARTRHPPPPRSVALMQLFANPFEKMAELMGPTDGPISSSGRGNFARPRWDAGKLREVHAIPPVYIIDDFLSETECDACREAAEGGMFPAVPYGAKNKIFTGTKWAAHMQHESVDLFLRRACEAFGHLPPSRFDPVTVTRYGPGEYQAKHLDARLPHEIKRTPAYLASGGQRIAQLIAYLESPDEGGATKFYGPAFKGLAIEPKKGRALIFPTATLSGIADERYLHSGEPVVAGTKWIVGTWLMETERTDAKDVANAIDALWKLEGRPPPKLTATVERGVNIKPAARQRETAKRVKKKRKQ